MSRFVCPHCLQFGPALYACPGCWECTVALLLQLNVGGLQPCPGCYTTLYPEEALDRLAYCEHCRQVSDARLHHTREVRLVGVIGEAAFTQVRRFLGSVDEGDGPLRLTDRHRATYLIDVSTVASEVDVTGAAHALRHLDALWLTCSDSDALELGRIVDRFVRQARLGGGQRRSLPVLIREKSLPAAALNTLRSRLSNLRYGVDLPELLTAERDWDIEALTPVRERPRVIATLHDGAFRTLADLLPADRVRRLHPGIACAEVGGRLTFLVDAGRLSHSRRERAAPVQQAADAIWIDHLPAAELLPAVLERLGVQFGHSRAARQRIRLLVQEPVDEERSALLTESFPNVRWGVAPGDALSDGLDI